mmetsp:Transcript_60787/g.130623  ORF Transcript_60787/g.130623 Transcript_60787/m.130623 type:complete len:201 (+) Transcript_60787:1475-2077(+)
MGLARRATGGRGPHAPSRCGRGPGLRLCRLLPGGPLGEPHPDDCGHGLHHRVLGHGCCQPRVDLRLLLQRRGGAGHPPDAHRASGSGGGPRRHLASLLCGGPGLALLGPAGRRGGHPRSPGCDHAPGGQVREAHRGRPSILQFGRCAPRAEDAAHLHRAPRGGRGLPPGGRRAWHRPHRLRRGNRRRDVDSVVGSHPAVW